MDVVSSAFKVIVKEKKAETAFVISVFTFVFGCFCIPIIIYAVDSNNSAGQALEIDLDVDNCPQQVRNNSTACGSIYAAQPLALSSASMELGRLLCILH